ncbi:phosphopantetheine-binding protein [Paenibacillus crassostreae]|uniref:Carrier domain-containing protein n=1 Tax=Paenibacillus crassostreae TaxID=1763538 RepID=A0A167FBD7_9BACL|nr:phosphopantetheine-binding protein [Paenibacillus crassostreae]AOZ90856.1 hypothetical protein LPB68_00640 [Paenibacillus crassostreae]OAB76378.1 hypothetical protein PNBC_02895 [Paenibacillus crassostreae]
MENIEKKVFELIVDRLELKDVRFEDIDYDDPIFASFDEEGRGMQLDSVDALEIVVGLNEEFGIKVSDENMAVFRSIRTIAEFIREQQITVE